MLPRDALRASALLVILVAAVSGCGPNTECGPGTRAQEGRCLPVCAPGSEADPTSGECVSICVPGTHRDAASGACLPDAASCVSGQIWDIASGICVDVDGLCAEGTTWRAGESRCVPTRTIEDADFVEGPDENDPRFGGNTAFEVFAVPAVGARTTLAGGIEAARDKTGDGLPEPDLDFWLFEVQGPTLLRVTADGLGGATSGVMAEWIGEGARWARFALGTTSAVAARDLYLPRAGIYALIMTDGLNLYTRGPGPYHGGEGFGYFVTVEGLEIPAPTPIETGINGQGASEVREWAPAPPDGGTSVGFFSVRVPAHSSWDFALLTDKSYTVWTELTVLDPAGFRASFERVGLLGFAEDTEVILVADHVLFWGVEPTDYQVVAVRRPTTWVDDLLPASTFIQEGWTAPDPLSWKLFGLAAQAGEVVTVAASSTTGRTCLEAWDGKFVSPLGRTGCLLSAPELHDPTLRFWAAQGGFHGLTTFDWQGGQVDHLGRLVGIPAHPYGLEIAVHRQVPVDLVSLGAPWSASEGLTADEPERFFDVSGSPGHAFVARLGGAIDPIVAIYDNGYGPVDPSLTSAASELVWRSVDGAPTLLGVADAGGAATSFEVDVRPLAMSRLGPVSSPSTLDVARALPAGERRGFFQVRAAEPGLVSVTVTPPPGLDVRVVRLDTSLVADRATDAGLAGGGESFSAAAAADGVFFEVATADGATLLSPAELRIEASLLPATPETEPNHWYGEPMLLPDSGVVAASIGWPGDADWYRLSLDGPAEVLVSVQPRGAAPIPDTILMVGDEEGVQLAFDDDGGPGRYSTLRHVFEGAGHYTIAVAGWGDGFGDYLLEVAVRAP